MQGLLSEEWLRAAVELLVRLVEAGGSLVIFAGAAFCFVRFLVSMAQRHDRSHFLPVRLRLGRFLGLGLEFQLAADLLRTAVAPTFEQIGMLAAIAAIRTALNYFLSRELEEERRRVGEEPG
jgi:uncharacterized membrane protein